MFGTKTIRVNVTICNKSGRKSVSMLKDSKSKGEFNIVLFLGHLEISLSFDKTGDDCCGWLLVDHHYSKAYYLYQSQCVSHDWVLQTVVSTVVRLTHSRPRCDGRRIKVCTNNIN